MKLTSPGSFPTAASTRRGAQDDARARGEIQCREDQAAGSHRSWRVTIRQAFYFVGVPLNRIFEHLDATIVEATPLYELCASVLQVDSAVT
jgi:hypothetical protein